MADDSRRPGGIDRGSVVKFKTNDISGTVSEIPDKKREKSSLNRNEPAQNPVQQGISEYIDRSDLIISNLDYAAMLNHVKFDKKDDKDKDNNKKKKNKNKKNKQNNS